MLIFPAILKSRALNVEVLAAHCMPRSALYPANDLLCINKPWKEHLKYTQQAGRSVKCLPYKEEYLSLIPRTQFF